MIELPVLSAEQFDAATQIVHAGALLSAMWQEQAGQRLALLAQQLLTDDLIDRPIVVLAGRGIHGGAGLVAARVLIEAGAWVQVVLTEPPELYDEPSAQALAALQAIDAPLAWAEEGWELPPSDLLIDTLSDNLGLAGAQADPQDKVRELIQLANSSVAPILSLGVPSGLAIPNSPNAAPHIQANATLLWLPPPVGLLAGPARAACGDLYLTLLDLLSPLSTQLGLSLLPDLGRDPILPVTVLEAKAFV